MIEKKTLLIIAVLAVVAILVLAIGLIGPAISSGGSGFTALFDKMTNKSNLTHTLVIQNGTYKAGDAIKVTDKIIAIDTHNSQSTTLYFLYQGTKWADETDGTSFNVMTDDGAISVEGAMFHIHIGTDLSVAFNVGNSITLQTQAVSDSGNLVLGHDWVLVSV
jgi:hypothetical protein